MFKRIPGLAGGPTGRLGLWEFTTVSEATEMIHRRAKANREADGGPGPDEDRREVLPNFARQSNWGSK